MAICSSTPGRSQQIRRATGVGPWLFALFLFAGYYKADPRLGFIQHYVDITLLFLFLSGLAFVFRWLKWGLHYSLPRSFARIALLFLLLAVIIVAGALWSGSRGYGLEKAAKFCVLTVWAFWGGALLITDFRAVRSFAWAVATIATVMAIDGILKSPDSRQFITAFGSNYIALARGGGFGLLATVGFLLSTESKRVVRLWLWVIAVLQLWATLSAGARGPVLALILSFLVYFAVSLRGFPPLKAERFAVRLGVLILLVVIPIAIAAQELFSTLVSRTAVALSQGGASMLTRLELYRAALGLWAESPIWGHGTGQFAVAVAGADVRSYPHNIVFELGAETGIIGVLIFGIMVGAAFLYGLRCVFRGRGLSKRVARYLLVASCFTLWNAMVSGDINDNRILFTTLGLLALTPRLHKEVTPGAKKGLPR